MVREHLPLRAELLGALPRGGARTRLITGIAMAYVAAWAIGIGFGYGLKGTHWWDGGAAWERSWLRYFHAQALPHWLDQAMLASPMLGTNLVILPLISWIERPEPLPFSITEAVLGEDKKAVLGENTTPAT